MKQTHRYSTYDAKAKTYIDTLNKGRKTISFDEYIYNLDLGMFEAGVESYRESIEKFERNNPELIALHRR
jgi:hypothetical protein